MSHFFPIHIFFGQDSEAFILIIYDIVIIVDRHFSAANELTICMTSVPYFQHNQSHPSPFLKAAN